MSIDYKSSIVVAEVRDSCHLNLNHLESLFSCCSAYINIIVSILDVKDNELSQAITAAQSSECVLPVSVLINLISSHGEHIDNLDES